MHPILNSKRFWSALVGLLVIVLSAYLPELRAHLDVIAPAVVGIIGVLVGGYTVEQTAQAWQTPIIIERVDTIDGETIDGEI